MATELPLPQYFTLPVTRYREPGGLTLLSGRQAMEGATSGRAMRKNLQVTPGVPCGRRWGSGQSLTRINPWGSIPHGLIKCARTMPPLSNLALQDVSVQPVSIFVSFTDTQMISSVSIRLHPRECLRHSKVPQGPLPQSSLIKMNIFLIK